MPEAPEVAYLADYISKHFKGKVLKSAKILRGRYIKHGLPEDFGDFAKALPLKLLDVQKKAKVIVFRFEKDWHIVSKLGITGWWYIEGKSPEWLHSFKPNLKFAFEGTTLAYADAISYGTMTFTQDPDYVRQEFDQLAPEAEQISLAQLLERVRDRPRLSDKLLEDVLLDQHSLMSGIGNYLKSEILYEAKLYPKRKVGDMTEADWKTLLRVAKVVIRRMRKHVDDVEAYEKTMRVYKKKADPDGNPVEHYKAKNDRMTYWVPAVQKAPKILQH